MNDIHLLILHILDLLTGGSLDYKQPHGVSDSRIEAGLRLLDADAVAPTDTPGCYRVRSEVNGKRDYYVSAIWGDLSCPCEDATNKKYNPIGLCKHQICAVVYEAQQMVFAQMTAREKAQAEEAA